MTEGHELAPEEAGFFLFVAAFAITHFALNVGEGNCVLLPCYRHLPAYCTFYHNVASHNIS